MLLDEPRRCLYRNIFILCLLFCCCLNFSFTKAADISFNKVGYYPRTIIGSESLVIGSTAVIKLGPKSKIMEILGAHTPGQPYVLEITARLENLTTNGGENITFVPDIDEQRFAMEGMVLYTINMTSLDISEELNPRIVEIYTTQKKTWFEFGVAAVNDTFYASKPNQVLSKIQIFLGVITYPVMAAWILLLIIFDIIYWAMKEKGKKNQAASGELRKKRAKSSVLIVVGTILCLIGIAFVIVVPFFTKRDTEDVCCTFFRRKFNYDGLPSVNYDNNCQHIQFINADQKKTDYIESCFAEEAFTIRYSAHIWWWLLLVGTIPGIILYGIGHALITVGVFKILRLVKKQHVAKGTTKFSVGFS